MNARAKTKRASIYCRTSSDDKQGVSIPQQVEDGKKLAATNGWEVAGVYIDQDVKGWYPPRQWAEGRRKIRPALSDMIDAIKGGKIDVVIARKLDRLSRAKAEEQHKLLSFFEQNEIGLACTHDSIPDISSATGELSIAMLLAISRYEWRKIRDNIKAAKDYQKLHNLKRSGACLLGYVDAMVDGKKGVAIDPDKAPIARYIFAEYAKGTSIYKVVEQLKIKYPYQTMTGKQWNQVTIKGMLINPKYIGMENYQGELRKTFFPAIIDMKTWAIVAERMKFRQPRAGAKTELVHLFSGILRCSYCGEKLVLMSEKRPDKIGKGKPYRYYCCPFPHRNCSKDKPAILREEEWLRLADELLSTSTLSAPTTTEQTLMTEQRIATAKARYTEALKLYATGDIDASALSIIKEQNKALQSKLEGELAGSQGKASGSIAWTKAGLIERRTWLNSTIASIKVYDTGAEVEFTNDARFTVGDTGMQFKRFWFPTVKIQLREKTRRRNAFLPLNTKGLLYGATEYKVDGIGKVWGLTWIDSE
jgi:DNA invertase Pin-like site-specific DNA recombinase